MHTTLTDDQWVWSADHKLPSVSDSASRVIEEVVAQLEQHAWSPRDIFAVQLALDEALVNAIKHGNRYAEDKFVHVTCRVAPHCVRVEIADEGPGFDPSQVPDCTCDDRLDVPSGRGLFLMRSYMCRVEYNERGNRVLLEKRRAG